MIADQRLGSNTTFKTQGYGSTSSPITLGYSKFDPAFAGRPYRVIWEQHHVKSPQSLISYSPNLLLSQSLTLSISYSPNL